MSLVHELDEGLDAARSELERLAIALAQADVTALEGTEARLADVVRQIGGLGPVEAGSPGVGLTERVTEVRWLLERCRRLGQLFLAPGATMAASRPLIWYGPDGTAVSARVSASTLEVTG